MSEEVLKLDRQGNVAVMTMNRPEKLNALSSDLRDAMLDALAEIKNDDNVRAAVITGEGRGFCAGADLTAGANQPPPAQNDHLDDLGWVGRQALSVYGLNKPIIAAMNGVAAGAGMSLACGCDMRVGSEKSRFKVVFIERNLSPDSGLSFFLPRIVGYSRAADLIYTSRAVDAAEAYRLAPPDRLVEPGEEVAEAVAIAEQMAQWPPLALRMSKRVLQHNIEVPLEDAVRYELTSLAFGNRATNDAKESRASFLEKRKPNYTGT